MVSVPSTTASTGRFAEPTIFSAILNASADIVKDQLILKDVGTIPQSTT
jgi:hypothetical protein